MTRPPFTYYGGKTSLAPAIAGLLPPHAHYVEPFAGSLAVLLAKRPAAHETVNDIDGDLVTFWRVLRDQPEELAAACWATPHSRQEYAMADLDEPCDDLERARRVWVQLTQGRAGTLRNTGWRHYKNPAGSSSSMPAYLDGYVRRIHAAAERLRAVSIECREAIEVITTYGANPNVLIYADPPYLGTIRARNYRHEMASDIEHRRLAYALHACEATVVLSGYRSPLYDELYGEWRAVELKAPRHGRTSRSGAVHEVLWSNRPLVDGLPMELPT